MSPKDEAHLDDLKDPGETNGSAWFSRVREVSGYSEAESDRLANEKEGRGLSCFSEAQIEERGKSIVEELTAEGSNDKIAPRRFLSEW